MARWKETACQGHREDVIDRVHWLWSIDRERLPIDLDPGPSMQWYPEKWESDPDVQIMPWAAKAMHLHLIHIAFKDARPAGSIASEEEMRIQCGDPEDVEWNRLRRTLLRSWVERHGRMWQPGTCRAYLGAIIGRLRRAKAAAAKWKNHDDKAKQERGNAMEEQCILILDALHGPASAMLAASAAMHPLPSPTPSPSPSPVLTIEEEGIAADAAEPNEHPDGDLQDSGMSADAKPRSTEQQRKLQIIADWFDAREDLDPPRYKTGDREGQPQWGTFGQWLKICAGDPARVIRMLEKLESAAKMGNWGYFGSCLKDWAHEDQNGRRGRRRRGPVKKPQIGWLDAQEAEKAAAGGGS